RDQHSFPTRRSSDLVRGKVQDRGGEKKMLANSVMLVEEVRQQRTEWLELRLDPDAAQNGLVEKLGEAIKSSPGDKPVCLIFATRSEEHTSELQSREN